MVLSKVDTSFNIPVWRLQFLTSSSSLVTVFMKAGVKWYLRAVLLFLFLMPSDVKMLLVCRLTRYKSSLVKRLLRSFALFFFWLVCALRIKCYELFVFSRYQSFVRDLYCECCVSSLVYVMFFWRAKLFNFDKDPIYRYFFLLFLLFVSYLWSLCLS